MVITDCHKQCIRHLQNPNNNDWSTYSSMPLSNLVCYLGGNFSRGAILKVSQFLSFAEESNQRIKHLLCIGNNLIGWQYESVGSFVTEFIGHGNWSIMYGMCPVGWRTRCNIWDLTEDVVIHSVMFSYISTVNTYTAHQKLFQMYTTFQIFD